MRCYLKALKKYAVFAGRARRKEYWMFWLINLIITVGLFLLLRLVRDLNLSLILSLLGPLTSLYLLAVMIPSIAVTVRRLHDTGRSGWWILVALIPLIGGIVLLIFMVLNTQPGANQYGSNPKTGYSIPAQ